METVKIMDRRHFLQYSMSWFAIFPAASRATDNHKKVKETISSVLITTDEKRLVAMTSRYHYVFDIPPPLLAAIKGSFHPYVQAEFSEFHVDMVGTARGTVSLTLSSATDDAVTSAIDAGFTRTPGGAMFVATLNGHRYTANDAQPVAQYKLNKPYEVELEDELRNYSPPSPIVKAAGYLTIYGILLVVAPKSFTSQ
jgi:hypothetical protein